MLIFLIFTIAQAFNAENTYTIHTIERDHQDHRTPYPELYAVQHVFDSIGKEITLQDGRTVLCQIPIPQLSKPLNVDELSIARILIEDEANSILFPLIDLCVHHTTKEFLYEYCFRKHVRQYDDLDTIQNMQKILKEDFSLGYSNQFISKNYSYAGFEPPNSSYYLDTNYHQIRQQIDRLIIIEGCLAKLRNYQISDKFEYQLNISTSDKMYTFRVIQVIYNELLLLSSCSDVVIISDYYEIIQLKKQKSVIKQNQYYQYKDIIYGLDLQAQTIFHPQQSLGVILTDKPFLVQVKKVIDYCAIQILGYLPNSKDQKSPSLIQKLMVMDTNAIYELLKGSVLISENTLFYHQDNRININDFITLFDNTASAFTYVESFRVSSEHNGIAILDKKLTKGLRYEGRAFIRRSGQFNKLSNVIPPQLDTFEFDDEYLISLNKLEYDLVQVHIFNNPTQGYQIKQQYQKYMGVTFSIYQLNNETACALFINLISHMYLDTQIIILTQPQPNIYVKNKYGRYVQMESRFQNSSLLNQLYWIIVDTETDVLYVGKGNLIKLSNTLIEFKIERIRRKTYSPIIFEFDKKSSGLKIYDIMPLPLIDFGLFTTNLSTQYYHPLNFTGEINGVFEEHYRFGSFCNPINSTRQSRIKLECYPGDLMRFISVTEEETCKYQIRIGTYLLCDKKYEILEPGEHPIMCMLKQ
ncbi:unnamed protein product (macronuclear) [Paramecium tetraurelia]|uniref:Protein OS9-like domain-containing protein n=1 Tax=Paramecium tetraurelia TaxID=5888 RepID=A0CKZ0_PARTE|nr:uncharacterized protein GSPATT00008004001 [Paramecium tetraurelia]CAK71457.1 unnamed protein product [Paramecium tetraurelia]|eukprot:XP_001438854.1 hypothetical protein (macronuclear) [Paramecium tetraurelia strain d4-2]